ncbi:Response regulator receiver domain-containing protein [Cohaesibacter gelatinilyticus]|uniref:Response regulator receiver domain-containing protein n=2 Tax=Cohaesibacter gelatinilyticus TaxID=372072 RepID=A0A285NGH0_9HYPH|nr:Response regulator receiver domain-containing protein [Cohaesibacter gelatinilyticus]
MVALRKILVADDSSTVRTAFCQAIEQIDQTIEIIQAKDGVETAAALANHVVDMAFIDVNMPGMSGIEALELARKAGVDTFVVLMSGHFDPQLISQAKRFHAYDYLKKPFQFDEIKRLLSYQQRIRHQKSLLVVDDSKVVRRVVFKVLNESQFSLNSSEADSGEQAIQLCRSIPYDIIFMDYHMPGFDGLRGAREVMKILPKAKIILMSADGSDQVIEKARTNGLAGFMKKPFYPDDVDMILHEIMGLKPPSIGKEAILFPQKEVSAPAAKEANAEDDDAFLI